MGKPVNPFFQPSLSAAFSRPAVLRAYVYYLSAMSFVLFFWWPRTGLSVVFEGGPAPRTFVAAAVGMFACLVYISARLGAECRQGATRRRTRERRGR